MAGNIYLISSIVAISIASFFIAPRTNSTDGFFKGVTEDGRSPTLITLILSQVTTWIFARSLLNAAILGYYFGIAGAIAYATYYLSFLTGGMIVDKLRFQYGVENVQAYLHQSYGTFGHSSYNVVIGVRLLSEVFANLLVVGIIFGVAGSFSYIIAIIAIAILTLGYSMMGGLSASLRTDVLQTLVLYAGLVVLITITVWQPNFNYSEIIVSSPDLSSPGWVLLAVAALQIWSYPLHDPVMMDRGFITDRRTTRASFLHACWISIIGIMIFGIIGTYAGLNKLDGEAMVFTLTRLLGEPTMLLFNFALIVSAVSTLDSTLSSASKLIVSDMGIVKRSVQNGRIAMALFLLGGLIFLFIGSKDLFAAVAVSGTASMFLTPVILFNIIGNRQTAQWAYAFTFFLAMGGAVLYMLESGGHISLIEPIFGYGHKYSKLLLICACILIGGLFSFSVSLKSSNPATSTTQ